MNMKYWLIFFVGIVFPNRRISEVAYDVGFQSLTQWTFKRVFDESPSDFRAKHATGWREEQAA
jgi:AraC-like DNA-binding protein